jgi:steroid delta-isomerase-like uncharacterized protein
MQTNTINLIKKYYDSFNHQDMETFLSLLDENIIHDINQGGQEIGKSAFKNFMHRMNTCYKETIENLIIMSNTDGSHTAAEFVVKGTYLKADSGLPEAKNQKYQLAAGAFFSIKNGKIARVTNYYNLQAWLKQVGANV